VSVIAKGRQFSICKGGYKENRIDPLVFSDSTQTKRSDSVLIAGAGHVRRNEDGEDMISMGSEGENCEPES
jgi:hypothetical protein